MKSVRILVMPALAILIGCDAGSSTKIGIVDIDSVAAELGRDKDWLDRRASETEALKQMVAQINQLQEQQREKLGESPSEEDQASANQAMLEARQRFAIAQSQANQRLNVTRIQMLMEVSKEAETHIRTLAVQKGLTLVFKRGDWIMAAQPAHDITRDVIDQMASMKPYTPPAEPPAPDAKAPPADAAP